MFLFRVTKKKKKEIEELTFSRFFILNKLLFLFFEEKKNFYTKMLNSISHDLRILVDEGFSRRKNYKTKWKHSHSFLLCHFYWTFNSLNYIV